MIGDGALRPAPQDLGRIADVDSFAIEPGVILLDRFCALDRVQRTAQGWSLPVTDLQRRLGNAPHHRLRLEYLRVAEHGEQKLRKAIRLDAEVHSPVHAWIRAQDGVLLVSEPVTGSPVTPPLSPSDAQDVGLALAAAVSQLHAAGVTGVAFSPEALHLVGRDVRVVGFEHVLAAGTAEEDVHRLADLLELLSGGSLRDALRPLPNTAVEVWDRVRTLRDTHPGHRLALPTTPPFVGREEVLARLLDAARRARAGSAQVIVVRGEVGSGRTRLLGRFAAEIARWIEAIVVIGAFKAGAQNARAGLVEVFESLAQQHPALTAAEHDAVRDRIRAEVGSLVGLVEQLSPQLSTWLGHVDVPANLQLDERFGQHAAALAGALRVVGTSRRPLVLLLDDADLADSGSGAVIEELLTGRRQHHTLVVLVTDRGTSRTWDGTTATTLDLEPLTRPDVRELLSRTLPGGLIDGEAPAERLWQVGRGHPATVWATLQQWARDDVFVLQGESEGWRLRVDPAEVALRPDAQEEPLRKLQPHQHWLVLMSALRAGRVTVQWLAAASGWSETEVRKAIQGVIEPGLVFVEPDGGLRFANESIRARIESTASPEILANAHRQIADWLERESGASASQLAWHRELSRPGGRDERLGEQHVKGGKELLAIYDLPQARWHFDRALTRATSPAVWVDALEGRADVALLDGRTDEALDDYLQAMTYGGDPIRGLEIAAKAVHGFQRKSASEGAFTLASTALAIAREPLPASAPALAWAVLRAVLTLTLRSPALSSRMRDALCRLYTSMTVLLIAERPLMGLLCILRGVRHGRGLDSENAASVFAFYSAIWAALGWQRRAATWSEEAEAVGRRSGRPWGLGVTYHMRAQNEASLGYYEQASRSFEQAVGQFRLAGDLSVAVFSLALRAAYARENEPAERVIEWCRESETCARRQGNSMGILGAAALRAYIDARRGSPGAREATADLSREILALPSNSIELVNAHAFVALAYTHLGEPGPAWTQARLAANRLDNGPAAADYLLDAHVAVAAAVLATPTPTTEQERALRRSLRALRRHGRNSPRLAAAWRLYSARHALARGRVPTARALLQEVIDQHPTHRQAGYALEAHRLLADVESARDASVALQHRNQAHTLAVALGVEEAREPAPVPTRDTSPHETPSRPPPPRLPERPDLPLVAVEPLIGRLRPAFERALPRNVALRLDIAPESTVRCNPESLQLLVVNLVLAARDALRDQGRIQVSVRPVRLEQESAAKMPGVRSDAHLLIEVQAVGYHGAGTISGLGVVSEITASIGGFVDVRQEAPDVLVLAAYLAAGTAAASPAPVASGPQGEALVLHADPRVRQTVVSALRDLGLRAEGHDPTLQLEGSWTGQGRLVFAEAEWFELVRDRSPENEIVLYARGTPAPSAPCLRVPFTISELQAAVEPFIRPDSNGTDSRP